MKFNFMKKNKVEESNIPENNIETAFVLAQYEKGGKVVGFLNFGGIAIKHKATINDVYRMVCDMKLNLESDILVEKLTSSGVTNANVISDTKNTEKS